MKLLFASLKKKANRLSMPVLFVFVFIILSSISFQVTNAQGNLLITPRRVVLDPNKRSMELNLANTGKDSATYSVSIIQIRMKEDGGFEQITEPDPGQRFADKYVRFFPRVVKLGPNESQVVKVQLTRVNELTDGEYRSHFYFRSVPKSNPLGEKELRDTSNISVKLTPIFGITIPVIVRSGTPDVTVKLSDLSLDFVNDTIPQISMKFSRTGNMSVYGDLAIDHVSPSGTTTRVGVANGVAVYTPNQSRRLAINLRNVKGVNYKAGKIIVTYSASSDVKPAKFAEAVLMLK